MFVKYCPALLMFGCLLACILTGCQSKSTESSSSKATELTLEEILRKEVQKRVSASKNAPDPKNTNQISYSDLDLIIDIASKAIGEDGAYPGKIEVHSETRQSDGSRIFLVSWRRELIFTLGEEGVDSQEVFWKTPNGLTGTVVNLDSNPDGKIDENRKEFASVRNRLASTKAFFLKSNDPLHQALTLSGYPDATSITDLGDNQYQAISETKKAELVVDATSIKSAEIKEE